MADGSTIPTGSSGILSINLGESDEVKKGLSEIVFNLDKSLISYVVERLYDARVEFSSNSFRIIPNAEYYECPVCHRKASYNALSPEMFCTGDIKNKHDAVPMIAVGWSPLVTPYGLKAALSTIYSTVNKNIMTANFNITDKRVDTDTFLRTIATNIAKDVIAQLVEDSEHCFNTTFIKDLSIINRINTEFATRFIVELAINIYASLSKGKMMKAVNEITSNRIETSSMQNILTPEKEVERNKFLAGITNLFNAQNNR